MPLRDHSLNIKSWFINYDLFENVKPSPITPKPAPKSQSFCELLLDKYYECIQETKTPQQTCKSEYEIIYLTRCVEILENDKRNKNKTKI